MRRFPLALGLATVAALIGSTQSWAQSPASHYANRPWEANFHVGALIFDDDVAEDTEAMFGARLVRNWPSGWGVGGNFDYSEIEDVIDTYLLSLEIDYTFGSWTRAHFFVGGGLGVAIFSVDEEDEEDDSESELLVPLALGVKWFNRTNDPNWALRGEVRDNIIRFDQADETTNNIELSGGISLLL